MSDSLPTLTYEFSLSDDPGDPWQLTCLWAVETINRGYHAVIDAATEVEDPDTDALLGCNAVLKLLRGDTETRALCGLVTRLDFLGYKDNRLFVRFHLEPAFEALAQRVNSRIWQELSVQDIVAEVLDEALGDYERSHDVADISRGTEARDYCVQYRESDRDFVRRLLEDEGVSYEFLHDPDAGVETLTFRDANEQYTEFVNLEGSADLPIIPHNPSEAPLESVQTIEWTKALTSTGALRRDYDWNTPTDLLSETAEESDERGRDRRIYHHGTRRFIADDLGQRAENLQLGQALRGQVLRGTSNVSAMRPGLRFKLHGHQRGDLEREYLITSVTHNGREAQCAADAAEEIQAYSNQFECVPFDAVVRPRHVTPRPREYGSQTAIVTGPDGEEIHTDEHGRIQIQFYWQEEPSYLEDSSCWVRCSQSWAGMSWGAQFIPRIGMEVVVEFLEGNPDRPLVTGCVYNAEFPPPFALPDNKTQSGWKTNSSPGGDGSNELRFEDAAGEEEVYLHSQKDWTIEIENDKTQTVGHDESLEIKNDRKKVVGNDEQFEIGNDQKGDVGNDQKLSVANDQQVEVGNDRNESIGNNANENVGTDKTVLVGEMLNISVGKDMALLVSEAATFNINGTSTTTVSEDANESVVGDKTVEATNLSVTLKEQSTYETGKDMAFASGKKYDVKAGDKITVKGDKEVTVEAAKKMTFKCGDASITLKSDGKITIKGGDINIKGSGNVKIKGQKVAGN